MNHYYMFNKNFRTDRKFKILSISNESLNGQRIDFDRIDLNSVKFVDIEEDVHIIACWRKFESCRIEFLIEHENYSQIPVGAMCEIYDAKIIDCIRLIKLSKNL